MVRGVRRLGRVRAGGVAFLVGGRTGRRDARVGAVRDASRDGDTRNRGGLGDGRASGARARGVGGDCRRFGERRHRGSERNLRGRRGDGPRGFVRGDVRGARHATRREEETLVATRLDVTRGDTPRGDSRRGGSRARRAERGHASGRRDSRGRGFSRRRGAFARRRAFVEGKIRRRRPPLCARGDVLDRGFGEAAGAVTRVRAVHFRERRARG